MRYEGLTQEFVDFIDDYKIAKVNDLIKKVKGRFKKMNLSEETEVKYTNILEHFSIEELVNALEEGLPRKHPSLFSPNNETEVLEWKDKLYVLKKEWKKEQEKTAATTIKKQKGEQDCYRVQSLKTSISTKAKNLLKTKEGYEEEKANISRTVKRMLNLSRLCYDLAERLNNIKETVPQLEQFLNTSQETWLDELNEISDKYDYANWLDKESEKTVAITYATHVAKLTHTKIKGTDIRLSTYKKSNFLTTCSIKNKTFDLSGNAALTPLKTFLKLCYEGDVVVDKLLTKNLGFLKVFAKDQQQLEKWLLGFSNVFEIGFLSTDHLAKQVFFPIKNNTYHLISPLMSSSLDHAIIEKIMQTKSYNIITKEKNDGVIEIRNQRYKDGGKYHAGIDLTYPGTAILKVTSTTKAHPNASPLNVDRRGQRHLFTSAPPYWETSLKPPIKQKSLFYGEFDRRAWHLAKDLQKYLLELKGKKSNKVIRDQVKDSVNKIIDALFNYVGGVQSIEGCAGWSEQAEKLEKSHKLWLDPYRDDEVFQTERGKGDWKNEVCQDFGSWMNKKLKHKKLLFSNIEAVQWAKLLKGRLREFERDLEVSK